MKVEPESQFRQVQGSLWWEIQMHALQVSSLAAATFASIMAASNKTQMGLHHNNSDM